jgi:hypothetical protein
MRSKISAKLSNSCLVLVAGLLIFFTPVTGRSQNTSKKCGYVNKYVYVWDYENEYNPSTRRYEYRYGYRYRYRYVYDCEPPEYAPYYPVTANVRNGEIKKIWVDYNVYEGQKKGMRIHLTFNVLNLKGKTCSANAYFYYASGDPLKDFNDKYNTTGGNVATHGDFTPGYANTIYNDFQLFMPYDELRLDTGKTDLKFVIELHCAGVGLVTGSQDYSFYYSR